MTDIMNIPWRIAEQIKGKAYKTEDIGRSGSAVLLFEEMVLKIEKTCEISDNEYEILKWLEDKLPVPRVLAFERENGYNYLLMTRIYGSMACEKGKDPKSITKGLAEGMKMLWALDISACPKKQTVSEKLHQAKQRLEHGFYEGKIPETEGFSDYALLYEYVSAHRPEEEFVFSHGDYCLPNIFLDGEKPIGFLDLGSGGIADKWYDITMCLWSMHYNFCELSGMDEDGFAECRDILFSEIDMEYDIEKIRYYQLLDTFFC